MDDTWRTLFQNWPEIIPRQGTLVTTHGEPIPFVNFMVSGGLLLVERDRPDTTGARKVMLTYESIAAVKLSTTAELSQFQSMGFQPPL